jgi:hypothetical protein
MNPKRYELNSLTLPADDKEMFFNKLDFMISTKVKNNVHHKINVSDARGLDYKESETYKSSLRRFLQILPGF